MAVGGRTRGDTRDQIEIQTQNLLCPCHTQTYPEGGDNSQIAGKYIVGPEPYRLPAREWNILNLAHNNPSIHPFICLYTHPLSFIFPTSLISIHHFYCLLFFHPFTHTSKFPFLHSSFFPFSFHHILSIPPCIYPATHPFFYPPILSYMFSFFYFTIR